MIVCEVGGPFLTEDLVLLALSSNIFIRTDGFPLNEAVSYTGVMEVVVYLAL